MDSENIVVWNAHGLNGCARRDVVARLVQQDSRKGFDCFVVLVAWHLWKERNARVFNNVALRTPEFLSMVRSQGHCWVAAGYDALSDFMHVKKNRLVVSLYNACTASTLYLYSVTRSPTRLQHQAIWSPTRLQHRALNSRGTSISNILPQSQSSKIEIVLKI
jgi:hypothetical protein